MNMLRMLLPLLGEGMKMTLGLFVLTLVLSLPLSLPVALVRIQSNKFIQTLTRTYIYIMRGTPLLLQMLFVFFGLPLLGLTLSRNGSIVLAFVLNYTAYFAEIYRGGIQSIPQGQWEAGKVLGLSRSFTFFKVILPQANRVVLPSIGNEVITLIKDTSLVYTLGVMDILKAAKTTSMNFSSLVPYIYVAVVYLALVAVVSAILNKIEARGGGYYVKN